MKMITIAFAQIICGLLYARASITCGVSVKRSLASGKKRGGKKKEKGEKSILATLGEVLLWPHNEI